MYPIVFVALLFCLQDLLTKAITHMKHCDMAYHKDAAKTKDVAQGTVNSYVNTPNFHFLRTYSISMIIIFKLLNQVWIFNNRMPGTVYTYIIGIFLRDGIFDFVSDRWYIPIKRCGVSS